MDPKGGGGKPSKLEAIKVASEYLRTFVADELHKLNDLKEKGALSAEEFDRAKAKLLA